VPRYRPVQSQTGGDAKTLQRGSVCPATCLATGQSSLRRGVGLKHCSEAVCTLPLGALQQALDQLTPGNGPRLHSFSNCRFYLKLLTDRQTETDKQTYKPTNAMQNITSLAKILIKFHSVFSNCANYHVNQTFNYLFRVAVLKHI